jgi:hypothetical protein
MFYMLNWNNFWPSPHCSLQTCARRDECERQHACGNSHRPRALWSAGPSQVAVWRLVQWRHARKHHGSGRSSWVKTTVSGRFDAFSFLLYISLSNLFLERAGARASASSAREVWGSNSVREKDFWVHLNRSTVLGWWLTSFKWDSKARSCVRIQNIKHALERSCSESKSQDSVGIQKPYFVTIFFFRFAACASMTYNALSSLYIFAYDWVKTDSWTLIAWMAKNGKMKDDCLWLIENIGEF